MSDGFIGGKEDIMGDSATKPYPIKCEECGATVLTLEEYVESLQDDAWNDDYHVFFATHKHYDCPECNNSIKIQISLERNVEEWAQRDGRKD